MKRVLISGAGIAGPALAFYADVFRRAFRGRFFSIRRGDLARIVFDTIDGKVETL